LNCLPGAESISVIKMVLLTGITAGVIGLKLAH